jgi:prephenate dehydrogenase
VLPYLPDNCILSDITSVKNGLRDFYLESGRRFVSTHPMFGPTFANVRELVGQSAIIIQQSDEEGKKFFRSFYRSLGLNIFEYTFTEHDETTAYSLSIPFASTMVFAACMRKQQAPGTTFQKHMKIAQGLLSEDDYLISEIMFNRYSLDQVEKIHEKLEYLIGILKKRDSEEMIEFLNSLRTNIKD